MDMKIQKICKVCYRTFEVYPYRKETALFCSNKCRWEGIGKIISQSKMGHKVSEETKLKISQRLKEITPKGKENRFWKNGLTLSYNKLRNSLEYRDWRNRVYKRDFWTCQVCKEKLKPGEIIAHHLKSFAFNEDIRYNINNGITLCRSCHAKLHKIYGDSIPLSYFS